ncbi:MAG: hypothetical protein ACXWJC_08095 [Croceibacterium sp.]
MHAFPPSSELQFLVGKELCQIAFDPNSVQFRWSEGGQITVNDEMEHVDESGTVHFYDCTAYTGPSLLLHRLIQKKIVMLEVQPFCLTLGFEGGQLLRLRSEEGPWECGLIALSDDLADGWIVF